MARKGRSAAELPANIESILVQLEKEISGDLRLRASVLLRLTGNKSEKKDYQFGRPATSSLFGAPDALSPLLSTDVPNSRKRKADSSIDQERPSKKQLIEKLHKAILGDNSETMKSDAKYGDPSQSPLLRLPRELRDMIYPYLLQSDLPIEMSTAELRRNLDLHPQILATSRLLHGESRAVLYGKNKFRISPLPEADKTATTPTLGLKVSSCYQPWLQHVVIHLRAFAEDRDDAALLVNSGLRDYVVTLARFLAFSKLKSLEFVLHDPNRKPRYEINFDKYFDYRTPLTLVFEHFLALPKTKFRFESSFGFYETLANTEKASREFGHLASRLQRLGSGRHIRPSILDDDETRDLTPLLEAEKHELEKESQELERKRKERKDVWKPFFEEIEKLLGMDESLKRMLYGWRW